MSSPDILISFCNVPAGAPTLGLYRPQAGTLDVLQTPPAMAAQGGATGLALGADFLFVATTRTTGDNTGTVASGPSGLFVFDRRDLSLVAEHATQSVFDAHSMILDGGDLLVVSTATNAVVRLCLEGAQLVGEREEWRPAAAESDRDSHHLNAIAYWGDRVVVSAFGARAGAQWSSARDGYVLDIRTGERIAGGIGQPHSVADLGGGGLAFCESASRRVRLASGDAVELQGYTRGLCRAGAGIFAATSRGRLVSRSTRQLTNRGETGALAGTCALYELTWPGPSPVVRADLDAVGWEVYDLLPVNGTERWPVAAPGAWRDALIAGYRGRDDRQHAATAWLHTEVAARDKTVGWLHAEVAERDKTIAWLHGEVARRDEAVAWLQRELAERDRVIDELRRRLAPDAS